MTNIQNEELAPVYRYFTADLLTNEVIAEIPFQGVTYKRALKAAGEFTGNIPVIEDTKYLNLYETTVPGKTALYVVRNGVCVWGGIIWNRSYDVVSKNLNVSGSEFTSYFYHRLIWKTWNHQFGATVTTTSTDALQKQSVIDTLTVNPLTPTYWTTVATASPSAPGFIPGATAESGKFTASFTRNGQSVAAFSNFSNSIANIEFRESAVSVAMEGTQNVQSDEAFLEFQVIIGTNTPSTRQIATIGSYRDSSELTSGFRLEVNVRAGSAPSVSLAGSFNSEIFTSSVQHKYVRIEERNLALVFSYSPDGNEWVVFHTYTHGLTEAQLASCRLGLVAGAGSGQVPGDTPDAVFPAQVSFSDLVYWTSRPLMSSSVLFDNGNTSSLVSGSFVSLEFFEPANFKHNGFYKVASAPAATRDTFNVQSGGALADIVAMSVLNGAATFTTREQNDYKSGDTVEIFGLGAPFDGVQTVVDPSLAGALSFSVLTALTNRAVAPVAATAIRQLPTGLFKDVTVTVRADTYGFVRSLIDAMGQDFVGLDFPNAYIEPGLSSQIGVTSAALNGDFAELVVSDEHNLAVGQAVQVANMGPLFDGEHIVSDVPSITSFKFSAGGVLAQTPITPNAQEVSSFTSTRGLVSATTTAAHGYLPGQTVDVFLGFDYGDLGGTVSIFATPAPTTFTYRVRDQAVNPPTALTKATATVGGDTFEVDQASLAGNVVTLTTKTDHSFVVGNTVTMTNVNRNIPLDKKSYDSANNVATFYTTQDHRLQAGSSVVLRGVLDSVVPTKAVFDRQDATTIHATLSIPDPGHNFRAGTSVTIEGAQEQYLIASKSLTSNVASLVLTGPAGFIVGDSVTVQGLTDSYAVNSVQLNNNVATLTTVGAAHNINVNDEITVTGISDSKTVVAREVLRVNAESSDSANAYVMVLTMAERHNFISGQEIVVSGVSGGFNGEKTVLTTTATRIFYELPEDFQFSNLNSVRGSGATQPSQGTVASVTSVFDGVFVASAATANTVSFLRTGNDETARTVSGQVADPSALNGTYPVSAVLDAGVRIQFSRTANNMPTQAVPPLSSEDREQGVIPRLISRSSEINGVRLVVASRRDLLTVAVPKVGGAASTYAPNLQDGFVFAQSPFNGTRTVTKLLDSNVFTTELSGLPSSTFESSAGIKAFAEQRTLYNGSFVITETPDRRSFRFSRININVPLETINSIGTAVVRPSAVVSTFGPYPGSANIGLGYSTRKFSGIRVAPRLYRGFELVSVGEALEEYADTIDGFEYRIDASFDAETQSFTKTLILIPINYPNAPVDGSVSPISRFGAEKLVFEYPGNIATMTIDEDAENSATRFFAVGENDLGPDAGPPFSVAASDELLNGKNQDATFRKWPLLDETEQVSGVDDETLLYSYAQRYLSESRPPDASLKVTVNGSLEPVVGSYAPGDWCSLIVDDDFVKLRLGSGLEPRPDIIIRKIDAMDVSVPDGVTFPEVVTLDLVPEWEVDKRGQQAI
jgi:hypothetical protein